MEHNGEGGDRCGKLRAGGGDELCCFRRRGDRDCGRRHGSARRSRRRHGIPRRDHSPAEGNGMIPALSGSPPAGVGGDIRVFVESRKYVIREIVTPAPGEGRSRANNGACRSDYSTSSNDALCPRRSPDVLSPRPSLEGGPLEDGPRISFLTHSRCRIPAILETAHGLTAC